ncbi:branched-chain amino acid ABC transporter [Tessaracoccus rhinocerotis]|uniref:Branched-chain amino acid ABC transporter n=1 Tax=Tessaracoccus rhinocerotis TaxID=1689449 RepID=A0A553K4F0_9ACTN|nr:AzlD domain-containing protein [Tessaracoccus rhinocerotis]TRY19564.1 branched-chain amino acid ABC transporter [Tessaracoccus rhinocerotis]
MPDWPYILAAVLVSAAITWALRALPFLFISRLRESELLPHLAAVMPVGIMTILVFYTLRNTDVGTNPATLAVAAGLAVTGALHLWRRNAVLSVLGGTGVHVLIMSISS